jgi:diadenylate cyclase
MPSGLSLYLQERDALGLAKDALDVFLVYYLLYRALLVVRGTRALQVGLGMAMVFVLYVFAQQVQLATLQSVLGALFPHAALLLIIVVFQSDIRRALMRVGSQTWFGSAKAQESEVIDEVVEAATDLARHRTGAIIAFEQDANLDEFVGANKGHALDAAVSRELLVSIFIPESMNKLHDGAVIIRDLRIAKAGVFFPMPDQRVIDPSFGSRHRASLGITEETDAVVVVVSEERGSISFCFNGNIVGNLDGPGLRRALEGVFSPREAKRRAQRAARERDRASRVHREPSRRELEPIEVPLRPAREETAPPAAEQTPTTRLRQSDPDVKTPSEPPAPLRKAKTGSLETREAETAPLPQAELPPRPARKRDGSRPMPRGTTEGARTGHADEVAPEPGKVEES